MTCVDGTNSMGVSGSSAPYRTVYDAVVSAAATRLDKAALLYDDKSITYAELLQRVDRAIACLIELDIRRGEAFALVSENRPEHLYCYYAASRLGAVFMPLNP